MTVAYVDKVAILDRKGVKFARFKIKRLIYLEKVFK